jgi:hypothetical protein
MAVFIGTALKTSNILHNEKVIPIFILSLQHPLYLVLDMKPYNIWMTLSSVTDVCSMHLEVLPRLIITEIKCGYKFSNWLILKFVHGFLHES